MTKDKQRTYAIIGTGAVGGFYGARLQQAGIEVHFLLNRDWQHVCEHGLVVESYEGNFTLPQLNAWRHTHEMPACDVVIVALKTTKNHLLPELLPPVVKRDGVILLLQNGLGAESEAAKVFDAQTVMGGLSFICSNKIGPGHIRHIDYGAINLGQYAPDYHAAGITEKMEQIKSDFDAAKIPLFLEEDLLQARWKKLVWNIPYNGLSVVLDARTDEIMASPHTRQLAASLMQEVAAGAAACDRVISDEFIAKMLEHTEKMKPYLTSMKLDFDRALPLEVEAIFGYPLRIATSLGADLPLISMLYHQLKFIDQRLSG